ncbi:unnamed protein product [Laminaria digitata]
MYRQITSSRPLSTTAYRRAAITPPQHRATQAAAPLTTPKSRTPLAQRCQPALPRAEQKAVKTDAKPRLLYDCTNLRMERQPAAPVQRNARSKHHTKLAKMSFDEIFDLTSEAFFFPSTFIKITRRLLIVLVFTSGRLST